MKILELTKEEAKKTFEFISLNGISEDYFNDLSIEYLDIRKFFLSLDIPEIEYSYDLKLALKVYEFFNQQQWFNDSVASNYGFWMYLSLKVIPEIIINRHGWMPEYFYDKNVRIYIPTLYWYIHMSFQGDLEKTYNILKTLNTDYIFSFN